MERGAPRAIGRGTTRVVDMEELMRARERRASSARHPSEQLREERHSPHAEPPRTRERPEAGQRGRHVEEPQNNSDSRPFWERESPFAEQEQPFWQQDRPFRGMEEGHAGRRASARTRAEAEPAPAGEQQPARGARSARATGREARTAMPERKPARHARESGRAGLKALLVLLALLAAMAVIGLKIFEIEAVEVKGAETMTPESVVALSGISRGENIFKVSLSQARQNLESDPLVEVLGISRVFPDRIKIEIRQRKPHGALSWLGGYVIVDERGFALDVRDSLPAGQYPLVTGVEIKPAERGRPVEGIADGTMKVMQDLLTALYDEKASQYVSEVNLADTNELTLLTAEGLQIDLGKPTDLDQKAKWIASSVPELRKQGLTGGILYVTGVNSPVYSAAAGASGDNTAGTAGSTTGDAEGEGADSSVGSADDNSSGDAAADDAEGGQAGEGQEGGPDNAA